MNGLPIGVYAVKFELSGFSRLVREGLQLAAGFNAQVNGELTVGNANQVFGILAPRIARVGLMVTF